MASRRKNQTYSSRPNHAARVAHAKGDKLFRTYDTSYLRPKRSKVPMVACVILAVVLFAAIVFGIYKLVSFLNFEEPSNEELLSKGAQVAVTIENGSTASDIGNALFEAKLVDRASSFTSRVAELDVGASLKAGTYVFIGGTSLDDLIAQLEEGPGMGDAVTIPEGCTVATTASLIESATEGKVSADDFIDAASDASVYASDYDFLSDVGTNSLEGFLFPKTYEIPAEPTADAFIRLMLDQFEIETASLDWSYPTSQGLSMYEALNLASIVEKESSDEQDIRNKVAAVFYNRLNNFGEPNYGYLQSDATTAYEVGHDPTADEVHSDSPYSTYSNQGLPPTPICSPSLASLEAVCNPESDFLGVYYYFYFEYDSNGELQHYFSKTYEEHQSVIS